MNVVAVTLWISRQSLGNSFARLCQGRRQI